MKTGANPPFAPSALRFGVFDLDTITAELRRAGIRVHLPPQALKVLTLLASHAGQLVTRDEIQREVWGAETFVDFEQGVNHCIKQIRAALGDVAETPRFVETLPRRGYRFIAPVVTPQDAAPDGAAPVPLPVLPAADADARIRLAVLPFRNLCGGRQQEHLADGLTEEMIVQLGRLQPERLGVIARTSAMAYKDAHKSVAEVGRELRVQYLLEGSVRCAGRRVRVRAQLVHVRDQTPLWAGNFDGSMRDVLALESDVAQAITREIGLTLAPRWDAVAVPN